MNVTGEVSVWVQKEVLMRSGSLDRRPQFDRLLDQLWPQDIIVVWRLERLGRGLKHLIQIVKDIADAAGAWRRLEKEFAKERELQRDSSLGPVSGI
jgi:DNA invertase Pin-like site-specific DNA recombinase